MRVVFSNSVIEHVGTWEDQQAFAAEVRRVGRRLWVPAYECPIEPHYLAPLVHYLPKEVQAAHSSLVHARGLDRASDACTSR